MINGGFAGSGAYIKQAMFGAHGGCHTTAL